MNTFQHLYHKTLCNNNIKIDYNNINNIHNYLNNNYKNETNKFLILTSNIMLRSNFDNKFVFLFQYLSNPFIDNKSKECLLQYFCSIQKKVNALNRLVYKYKYNKAIYANSRDLCFNPISPTQNNILTIYSINAKYLFSVVDIKNIIKNSLYNTEMYFSMPLTIKNPYNNSPFNKADLYNIYNFFKHNFIVIPLIFHLYYLSNFNLKKFQSDNEVTIRNYLIENYLKDSSKYIVVKFIKRMLSDFNRTLKIKNLIKYKITYDNEFPDDALFIIFKDLAQLYYKYKYTLDLSIQDDCYDKWFNGLLLFKKENLLFGRKQIKFLNAATKINKIKKKTIFVGEDLSTFNNFKTYWSNNDKLSHLDHTYNNDNDNDIDSFNDSDNDSDNVDNYSHNNNEQISSNLTLEDISNNNIQFTSFHTTPLRSPLYYYLDYYSTISTNTYTYTPPLMSRSESIYTNVLDRTMSDSDTESESETVTNRVINPIINNNNRDLQLNMNDIIDCYSDDNLSDDNDSMS
jgi:hypothetical protein